MTEWLLFPGIVMAKMPPFLGCWISPPACFFWEQAINSTVFPILSAWQADLFFGRVHGAGKGCVVHEQDGSFLQPPRLCCCCKNTFLGTWNWGRNCKREFGQAVKSVTCLIVLDFQDDWAPLLKWNPALFYVSVFYKLVQSLLIRLHILKRCN